MPRIKETTIEEVLTRANIVDVVSTYVSLKRAGSEYRGLSPFNEEKTPSFFVNPEKNFYYCFSSNEGGNVVSFLERMENLTYPEAIELLASRFNVPIEYDIGSRAEGETMSLKKELLDVHEYATSWFVDHFMADTDEGLFIREYWTKQRNFSLDLAKEFHIGYAPAGTETSLGQYLQKKKFSQKAMEECGLFFERRGQWISRFRGRLMIPIRNLQGHVIAFTARQTEKVPASDKSREAKYINSPETPLFQKGKTLFGLHHARSHLKQQDETFLLVEGQLDAMRCWEQGLHHAVAPQGTALTESQIHLLKKYTPRQIHCFLDGDVAGQKAGFRILPLCIKEGLDLFFLPLPKGIDPDDFLKERGQEGFEDLVARKIPPMEFALNFLCPTGDFSSPVEKGNTQKKLFELVQESDSETTQSGYLQQISRLLKVDEASVRTDYGKFKKPTGPASSYNTSSENNNGERLTNVNFDILCLILLHPEVGESVASKLNLEWIDSTAHHSKLLLNILIEIKEGVWQVGDRPDELLKSDEEKNVFYKINSLKELQEPEIKSKECLRILERNYLKRELDAIKSQIAENPDSMGKLKEIRRKLNELR